MWYIRVIIDPDECHRNFWEHMTSLVTYLTGSINYNDGDLSTAKWFVDPTTFFEYNYICFAVVYDDKPEVI